MHQEQVRDGNFIYGTTHFTRADGSTGLVGDVKFDFDLPGRTGTDGNDVLSGNYILAANDYEWQNAA